MKYLDLPAIMFVSVTLIHDYWLYWGLPRVQYWEIRRSSMNAIRDDKDDENKAA